jgi:hypothetical protein
LTFSHKQDQEDHKNNNRNNNIDHIAATVAAEVIFLL